MVRRLSDGLAPISASPGVPQRGAVI